MNYIYDIVLNFHEKYYEFFEWEKKDKIKNYFKIPIYRVSDKTLKILKENQVKINSSFLNQLKEDNKKNKKIICIVSNTKLSIGLLFNEYGTLLKRSSMIYEEEEEANEICNNLKITPIPLLENKITKEKKRLRLESERKEELIKYIETLSNLSTLKYLYYEYYQTECNNNETIKKSLKKELEKEWTQKQNLLYETIKILKNKNLMTK